MELSHYFKSIVDQDNAAVVICNLEHTIIYMNPAAVSQFSKQGGAGLTGKSIFDCHNAKSCESIRNVFAWFLSDVSHNRIHTFYNEKQNKDVYMIALRDGDGTLIGYYEKHEYRDRDMTPFYDMF